MRLEPAPTIHLAYVRPGRDAFTWLAGIIRDLKRADPFRPVTVLVPNDYAGRVAHWHLARSTGYVNVTTCRLSQVVAAVAPPISTTRFGPLLPILEQSAVREALRRHVGAFGAVGHRSLQEALLELFRELRRSEVDLNGLRVANQTRAARAALVAYRDFQAITAGYDDRTRRAQRASDFLNRARSIPPELARFGALVLLLPTRVDPAEARFLAAAARWVPVCAALINIADPQGLGHEPSQDIAKLLAATLSVAPPEHDPPASDVQIFADVRVLRAPDPAEEVREVVRCIADDLEHHVPLHRMAIVYRQDDPYAALVREALDAAGLPWSSSEGTRLEQTRPGRCLLSLLRLPERKFVREAVMEWIETGPIVDHPVASVPGACWDRLSRLANVVRGAEQWSERLETYASTVDEQVRRREREGDAEAAIEAWRRQAASARMLAEFVAALGKDLEPPTDGATWATFVDWTRDLRDRYVGRPERWPEDERAAAVAVEAALDRLRVADRVETASGPSLSEFLAALAAALAANRLPTGRLGDGILIEPIGAVTGLAFDRVYLLGMREGAFPPTPAVDPFFPDSASDPLDRRSRQLAGERQDFLVALATADGGSLTLCTPDTDGARKAFPSRWLLEVASRCAGRQLSATEFVALNPAEHPWLRVVRSAQQGVLRDVTPADLEDRRLQQAARWVRDRRPLFLHPMARRTDLPLGRALELARDRWSSRFTAFDGNVSALAGHARRLASIFGGRRAISATAVQAWATCGFKYFLERVLGVESTERPEDEWTITPLERGSLVHGVLEEFFLELRRRDQPRPDQRYSPADTALVEHIADKRFSALEASGTTGHPIAWENEKRRILADLRAFLSEDEKWRIAQAMVPSYFEQGFGFETDGSWPALDVTISFNPRDDALFSEHVFENTGGQLQPDHRFSANTAEPSSWQDTRIRFRGFIDRIDLNTTRGHAYVFDYKTGSKTPYKELQNDPVAAGQHVQLALYGRAVRRNLANVTAVGAAFWFITSKGQFEQLGMPGDETSIAARLDEVLKVISRGIRAGAFPQVPGAFDRDTFVNCRYCDFERICPAPSRRAGVWKRKQSDPLAALHLQLSLAATGDDGRAMNGE